MTKVKNQIHSKDKGSLGEISVAKALIRRGLPVFVEYGDNSKIDIITFKDEKPVTIQGKAYAMESGSIKVRTLRSGPNYKYNYKQGDFDLFAIYSFELDKIFYIPLLLVIKSGGSINLRLKDLNCSRINNVRYADDYKSLNKAVKYLKSTDLEQADMYPLSTKKLICKTKQQEQNLPKRKFMTQEIADKMFRLKTVMDLTNQEIADRIGVICKTVPRTLKNFGYVYNDKKEIWVKKQK